MPTLPRSPITSKVERVALLFGLTALSTGLTLFPEGIAHAQTTKRETPVLAEVVVTAERRAENMQNVPIAISAISGNELKHVGASVNTTNLQEFVPGLLMGQSGTAANTFLRGVGADTGVGGTESPIATYLNGVYLGVNALGLFDLNNVQQIAVLKGPQGTLFGRNATGGAIQIATKDPGPRFSGNADLGIGNFGTATSHIYLTGPISRTLSGNIAVFLKDMTHGDVYNEYTGHHLQAEKEYNTEGKLLWRPSNTTSVKLDLIHWSGRNVPGGIYFVQRGALAADGITRFISPYVIRLHDDIYDSTMTTIGALTVTHDMGWGRVTNVISKTHYSNAIFDDQNLMSTYPNPNDIVDEPALLDAVIDEHTEELRVQAPAGQDFQWIAGLFYYWDDTQTHLNAYDPPAANGALTPFYLLNSQMGTRSFAGYAQASKTILPATRLTLGIRYTSDRRQFSGNTNFGGSVPASLPDKITFTNPTWRFALDHRFSPEVMAYVSYDRGFRSGQYAPINLHNPPVRPEILDAYEIGVKTDLFDRKVRLNSSAFYYSYKDMQLRTYQGIPPTALFYNAANSRIYGLDADLMAAVTRRLRVTAALEALHAAYTSFPDGLANYPSPLVVVPQGCSGSPSTQVGGIVSLSCNLSGNEMIYSPKFSGSIGLDYVWPTEVGQFDASVADKYVGQYYASPDNFQSVPGHQWVTASLDWMSPSTRWYGRLWCTNLTDSYNVSALTSGGNSYEYVPGEPRMFGATFGVNF